MILLTGLIVFVVLLLSLAIGYWGGGKDRLWQLLLAIVVGAGSPLLALAILTIRDVIVFGAGNPKSESGIFGIGAGLMLVAVYTPLSLAAAIVGAHVRRLSDRG